MSEINFSKKEIVLMLLDNFLNNKKEVNNFDFLQGLLSVNFLKLKSFDEKIEINELEKIKKVIRLMSSCIISQKRDLLFQISRC